MQICSFDSRKEESLKLFLCVLTLIMIVVVMATEVNRRQNSERILQGWTSYIHSL